MTDKEDVTTSGEETAAPQGPDDQYLVHNVTNSPHTREVRMRNPDARAVVNIHLPGPQQVRVMPGRYVQVTQAHLGEFIEEYKRQVNLGLLMVTNMNLQRIDLDTGATLDPLGQIPRPSVLPDSAARDQNGGIPMATNDDQPPRPNDFIMPVAPHPASLEDPEHAKLEAQRRLAGGTDEDLYGDINPDAIPGLEQETKEQEAEMAGDAVITAQNLSDISAYAADKSLATATSDAVVDVHDQPGEVPVEVSGEPTTEETAKDEKSKGKSKKGSNKS